MFSSQGKFLFSLLFVTLLMCDLAYCSSESEGEFQRERDKETSPFVPSVRVWGFGLFSGFLPLLLQWRSCHLRYSTHDIYPGEGIDRCFKAALWHGQERPLVTLDKTGGGGTIILTHHVEKHIGPASMYQPSLQPGRKINKPAWQKCSFAACCICVFLHRAGWLQLPSECVCVTDCSVSKVWMKCTGLMMYVILKVFAVLDSPYPIPW